MKVQYIADHPSGKKGDIKEVANDFGKYLILRDKAVKYEDKVVETKEEKAPKKTKAK